MLSRNHITGFILCLALALTTSLAGAATAIRVIDDFENGVDDWTARDQTNKDNLAVDALLVDVLPISGYDSKGAALFTFKAANDSWASATHRIVGAQWAKLGARGLEFWISGGGTRDGVELILRGTYKNADGTRRDLAFELPLPIRLDDKQWRKVAIPLSDFKTKSGEPLAPRLDGLYQMEFAMRGTWSSRFFSIDQIQVRGDGQPIPQLSERASLGGTTSAPPDGEPEGGTTPAEPGAIAVNADFLRVMARVRPSANVSIGAPTRAGDEVPLNSNSNFRRAVMTLDPRFVRLDAGGLSDLIDSSRPAFDFSRLREAVTQVWAINREPLITISNPSAWSLNERAYALFAMQVAQTTTDVASKKVRYYEVAPASRGLATAQQIAYYNRARGALKSVSKENRVGGIGEADAATLNTLLQNASGLDFLTLSFFGAESGQPSPDNLFAVARQVAPLQAAATALDRSKFRNAPIYVTRANLNAALTPGAASPLDSRVTGMVAAAWWSTFLGNSSRLADQVFHNDGAKPGWGLLDDNVNAYPAYYVMYLWNTYFPPGSERVQVTVGDPAISAIAVNTPTAHNLMLANTTDREVTARVGIRGFPVLRQARMHVYDDPQQVVRPQALPKSAFQTIRLKPYAVTVLQFIEPPKNGG